MMLIFFKQQFKSPSLQLHEIHSKKLEYGNKKNAKEKLHDVLESSHEISKLRMSSAVEGLVN